MPHQVTQAQAVQAINAVLPGLEPPGQRIANLDTDSLSDPAWSCNDDVSPPILRALCGLLGIDPDELPAKNYVQGAQLPAAFDDGTFVNISMLGQPSGLNHNFNILVSGGTTYLIEAFLGFQVNIVRRMTNAEFITRWHDLSGNVGWTDAYLALFGVAPADVLTPVPPPAATWLTNQWVAVV